MRQIKDAHFCTYLAATARSGARTQRSTSIASRSRSTLHGVVFAIFCPGAAVHRRRHIMPMERPTALPAIRNVGTFQDQFKKSVLQRGRRHLTEDRTVDSGEPTELGELVASGDLRDARAGGVRAFQRRAHHVQSSQQNKSGRTVALKSEFRVQCGPNSRSSTAAGNGILGCRDRQPKIIMKTAARLQRQKSGIE